MSSVSGIDHRTLHGWPAVCSIDSHCWGKLWISFYSVYCCQTLRWNFSWQWTAAVSGAELKSVVIMLIIKHSISGRLLSWTGLHIKSLFTHAFALVGTRPGLSPLNLTRRSCKMYIALRAAHFCTGVQLSQLSIGVSSMKLDEVWAVVMPIVFDKEQYKLCNYVFISFRSRWVEWIHKTASFMVNNGMRAESSSVILRGTSELKWRMICCIFCLNWRIELSCQNSLHWSFSSNSR